MADSPQKLTSFKKFNSFKSVFLEVLGPWRFKLWTGLKVFCYRVESVQSRPSFFSPNVGAHIHTGMHYAQSFPFLFQVRHLPPSFCHRICLLIKVSLYSFSLFHDDLFAYLYNWSSMQWKSAGWLLHYTSSIRGVYPIRLNSLSVPGHGRNVGPSDSISCHLSVKWAEAGQRRHRGQCGDLSC